jgi:two-component sensor histidine kinase
MRSHREEAIKALQNASARVLAIAAVHEGLYAGSDIRVVPLGPFLSSLCSNIADALGRADCIEVDIASIDLSTDMAIPLALAVNELLTNAVKYGRSPYRVIAKIQDGRLALTVSDSGQGPATDESRTGLGSHIVKSTAIQLGATVETLIQPDGYFVEFIIPMGVKSNHESPNSGRGGVSSSRGL